MSRLISNATLRALRNQIQIHFVITELLKLNTVNDNGLVRFQCPKCQNLNSATNLKTNLARCFRCQINFNPIDIVIAARGCSFKDAVEILSPYLPANHTPSAQSPSIAHPSTNRSTHSLSLNSQLDHLIRALAAKSNF